MKHQISTLLLISFCSLLSFCAISQDQFICEFKYSEMNEAFLTIDNIEENGHRNMDASYISFLGVSDDEVLSLYLEDRDTKQTLLSANVNLKELNQQKYFFYNKENQISAVCKKLSH